MRWIAFSALIVLILLSLTTPVFAPPPEVLTDKGSYQMGETVYATATSLNSVKNNYFDYSDPNTVVYSHGPVTESPPGEWHDNVLLDEGSLGTWVVAVRWNSHEVCSNTFEVTAAPEFPSIFALGAGMMFLICGAIYFGMRKHAVRKV